MRPAEPHLRRDVCAKDGTAPARTCASRIPAISAAFLHAFKSAIGEATATLRSSLTCAASAVADGPKPSCAWRSACARAHALRAAAPARCRRSPVRVLRSSRPQAQGPRRCVPPATRGRRQGARRSLHARAHATSHGRCGGGGVRVRGGVGLVCGPQTVMSTPDDRSVSSHGAAGTLALHSEQLRVFVCVFCLSVCLRVCAHARHPMPRAPTSVHAKCTQRRCGHMRTKARCTALMAVSGLRRPRLRRICRGAPVDVPPDAPVHVYRRVRDHHGVVLDVRPTHIQQPRDLPCVPRPHDGYPTPHGRRVTTRRAARRGARRARSVPRKKTRCGRGRAEITQHGTALSTEYPKITRYTPPHRTPDRRAERRQARTCTPALARRTSSSAVTIWRDVPLAPIARCSSAT